MKKESYYNKRTLKYSENYIRVMTLVLIGFGNYIAWMAYDHPILFMILLPYTLYVSKALSNEVIR